MHKINKSADFKVKYFNLKYRDICVSVISFPKPLFKMYNKHKPKSVKRLLNGVDVLVYSSCAEECFSAFNEACEIPKKILFKLFYYRLSKEKGILNSIAVKDKDFKYLSYDNLTLLCKAADKISIKTDNKIKYNMVANKIFDNYGILLNCDCNFDESCNYIDFDKSVFKADDFVAEKAAFFADFNRSTQSLDLRIKIIDRNDESDELKLF